MKYKSEKITERLFPLIKSGRQYIIAEKPDLSDIGNKELEGALHNLRNLVGGTMRASLQMKSVYDDTVVCHKMIGSFPWKKHRITRAQHLNFIWSQFTNLCYMFEERFKLFMGLQHRTMASFKKRKVMSISDGIKDIRKALGAHIRQRGQNTHEWTTTNPHAQHFETIEFINSVEAQADGSLGNVDGQYRITRLLMRWEIETAIKFMEEMLLKVYETQIPELVDCASILNEVIDKSRTSEVTINENEITLTLSRPE